MKTPYILPKSLTDERVTRARTALLAHYNDVEREIITLLTDVKHLCREEQIDFANCVRLADAAFIDDPRKEMPS